MKYKIFHGNPVSVSDRRFVGFYRIFQLKHTEVMLRLLGIKVGYPKLSDLMLYTKASHVPMISVSQWEIIERVA